MEKQFCRCIPRKIEDYICSTCGGDKVNDCASDLLIENLLYSEHDIQKVVKTLALQISKDYALKQPLVLLCVLKGAYVFTSDLSRAITIPHTVEFIRASSYEGVIADDCIISEEIAPPTGKHVLIVDTGLTLKRLIFEVESINPLSVECCALIQNSSHPNVKYIGMTLDSADSSNSSNSSKFVVGYGLDEHFRRLPYIATASLRSLTLK